MYHRHNLPARQLLAGRSDVLTRGNLELRIVDDESGARPAVLIERLQTSTSLKLRHV